MCQECEDILSRCSKLSSFFSNGWNPVRLSCHFYKHDRLSNGESRVEREYSQKKKTKLKKILKKLSRLIGDEYLTDTRPSIAS